MPERGRVPHGANVWQQELTAVVQWFDFAVIVRELIGTRINRCR